MKKLLIIYFFLVGCYAGVLPTARGTYITDSWANNCPHYQGAHKCGPFRAAIVEVFNNTPDAVTKTVVCKYSSSGQWFGSQTKTIPPVEQETFMVKGIAPPHISNPTDRLTCLLQ